VPSKLAAALCVLLFLTFAAFAIGAIVLPAIDWVALIPERIGQVRATLEPLLDLYNAFERFVEGILSQIGLRRTAAGW
jgi:predicted PurR-regulated permease PerM